MPFDLHPTLIQLFFIFFGIAFLRNTIIYWVARAIAKQATKKITPKSKFMQRMQVFMSGDNANKGVAMIHRWGPLAVVFSFFAPGTKTIVNTGAGLTQMRYAFYLPALIVGCSIHGIIYATIGWAAWVGMLKVAAGSPWGITALIVIIMGLGTAVIMHARKERLAGHKAALEQDPNEFDI